jgi:predicted enzyme related to lactoylglutathione lyase
MSAKPHAGAVLFAKDVRRLASFYEAVTGLRPRTAETDHIVLESAVFQLVIHAIPEHIAKRIHIDVPARPREDTPIKLAFFVSDLSASRRAAVQMQGVVNEAYAERQFEDSIVCDGHDPEGNVFQLRQPLVR